MDCYRITRERLGEGARIPLVKLGQAGEVFHEAALDMVETIKSRNASGKPVALILPVGPVGQYPIFVRLVNEGRVDLRNAWFINMDEYLGEDGEALPPGHRLSFRGFMEREVYARLDPSLAPPPAQRVFPDPRRPGLIAELVDRLGGVDACYGGIGINGHLAFNEPEEAGVDEYRSRGTRVLEISPETRTTNAIGECGGALEAMPRRCVTVGMREILGARKVRLYCFRDWHRAVVRRAAYGEISAAFPASLLQAHPDARITMSDNVAEAAY